MPRKTVLSILILSLVACSKEEPVETLDIKLLRDDWEKSELQIKLDHMKLVRYNISLHDEVMPDNILSVKYTEKGRWRKLLQIFERYGFSEMSDVVKFENIYNESSTGITQSGYMYYEIDECPEIPEYFKCDGDRVSYKVF